MHTKERGIAKVGKSSKLKWPFKTTKKKRKEKKKQGLEEFRDLISTFCGEFEFRICEFTSCLFFAIFGL